jgi:hypothetical protein
VCVYTHTAYVGWCIGGPPRSHLIVQCCQLAVANMESSARGRRAVVYYCNEGINGFDAPGDDPMKSALTCDLILCPKCEAKRRALSIRR